MFVPRKAQRGSAQRALKGGKYFNRAAGQMWQLLQHEFEPEKHGRSDDSAPSEDGRYFGAYRQCRCRNDGEQGNAQGEETEYTQLEQLARIEPIECSAELRGGEQDKPSIGVVLDLGDSFGQDGSDELDDTDNEECVDPDDEPDGDE